MEVKNSFQKPGRATAGPVAHNQSKQQEILAWSIKRAPCWPEQRSGLLAFFIACLDHFLPVPLIAVQRLLAILVVLFFGSGTVLPALAMNRVQSGVPICCRKDGGHHCKAPGREIQQSQSGDDEGSLAATCPTSHQASAVNLVAKLLLTSAIEINDTNKPAQAVLSSSDVKPFAPFSRSDFARGPPPASRS